MTPYLDPELWEEAKAAARERLGGHSARAMQLAGELYRRAGGRYQGRKTAAQRALTRWSRQDWTTRSGKPSRKTGERYLPRKVIEKLTPAEYAATTRAKREGTKQGKQYVTQPPKIRAKVARLKREDNPMARTATPAQIAARKRFAEMARSGAFAKKAKRNPSPKVKANPRAARRPSLYVGPDPGNRFAQCYSALDDIDFESPYFRERRVTLAKARRANAMLDKILDQMEKIAKIING